MLASPEFQQDTAAASNAGFVSMLDTNTYGAAQAGSANLVSALNAGTTTRADVAVSYATTHAMAAQVDPYAAVGLVAARPGREFIEITSATCDAASGRDRWLRRGWPEWVAGTAPGAVGPRELDVGLGSG